MRENVCTEITASISRLLVCRQKYKWIAGEFHENNAKQFTKQGQQSKPCFFINAKTNSRLKMKLISHFFTFKVFKLSLKEFLFFKLKVRNSGEYFLILTE